MLGEYKFEDYGSKKVKTFAPYSLNSLYITTKRSPELERLEGEIHELFPLPRPQNSFFYDLLLDIEMLDSFNLNGSKYTLADLHAPSDFDLFAAELKELKEIYEYAPEHLNKLGYSNRFLKDFQYALFKKHVNYYPGEYRKTISYLGSAMDHAIFISANPNIMQENMDEMELFMHRDDVSVFVRSALLYYQIMTNLPFLIGNDLVARSVSQLYLREFGVINHYIPLSRHLKRIERKRFEAIEKGDLNIFLLAFLNSLKAAILETKVMINGFNRIKNSQKRKIAKSNHTIYQKRRLNEILHQSHKTVYLQSQPLQERFKVLNKTIVKRYRFLHELGIIKTEKTYFAMLYFNQALLKLLQ
ncbi:MAG: hypothetical protein GX149_00885 [Acholeplasmataceae bacterium]|jgi:Fic family protein|nr:hypothetical protein [Acholeplasmataceae bacterium]